MSGLRELDAAVAREVVLRVDFELLDDGGCFWVSLRFHRTSNAAAPVAGDAVYLLDGQGGGCVGRVERVDGWYVCVRPDWSTWSGGESPGTGGGKPASKPRKKD